VGKRWEEREEREDGATCIIPPPLWPPPKGDKNCLGSLRMVANQSNTCVSNSVHAGDVIYIEKNNQQKTGEGRSFNIPTSFLEHLDLI